MENEKGTMQRGGTSTGGQQQTVANSLDPHRRQEIEYVFNEKGKSEALKRFPEDASFIESLDTGQV